MIGSNLSHYKVTDKLGEGGMGEVYKAEDSQLGREVAIKVLPEAFTEDPERLARFEREARVLAALDHPSIAAIYGLEEAEGRKLLVMQLAPGETLQERIARGPVPMHDALRIARQIADALEAAHEKGIIHRDLKPANVMVSPEGTVKVLDFGLAKALESETDASGSAPSLTMSPTLTAHMTTAGVLLGTAGYMSPEQARGEAADKRADLWAFGVVLWEMLTGKQLFIGKTLSDTLAGVLRADPEFEDLPDETPSQIRRLLRRCLEREAKDRLPDATSARLELVDALAGTVDGDTTHPAAVVEATPEPAWRRLLPWAIAGLCAAGLIAVALLWWPEAPASRKPIRLDATVSAEPFWMTLGSSVVLSPDGSRLAYVTGDETDRTLWTRSLDQLKGAALAGGANTENVYHPVFSPDGEWIAYVTPAELKKVPVSGGASITLSEVNLSRGATWLPDDTIVVAATDREGLSRVPAAGGDLSTLTTLNEAEKEISHRWPQAMPDGKSVIFTVFTQAMPSADEALIAVADLATGEHKVLHRGGYYGRYVPTGHLVYLHEGTLFAVPFDPDTLEVSGSAAPIVQGITASVSSGGAQFTFANDGTLAYVSGELGVPEYPAIWVDRNGQVTKLWETPASYANPRLSPDGNRLSFSILEGSNWDVWVYDLEREVATRLTFHDGYDADQIWTPDGEYLIFTSDRNGAANLYRKRADGSGEAEALTEGELQMYPISLSPDGKVALAEANAETLDIYTLPLDGSSEPEPYLVTSFLERDPVFSPNGRWVAYASNESGRPQIYVRPYPAAGGRWQVSDGTGRWPIWSRDGNELFYRTNEGIMVADVETEGPTFRVGKARSLFEGRFRGGLQGIAVAGFVFPDYHVAADGERFVMFPDDDDRMAKTQATFVFNWFDELEDTLPTGQ